MTAKGFLTGRRRRAPEALGSIAFALLVGCGSGDDQSGVANDASSPDSVSDAPASNDAAEAEGNDATTGTGDAGDATPANDGSTAADSGAAVDSAAAADSAADREGDVSDRDEGDTGPRDSSSDVTVRDASEGGVADSGHDAGSPSGNDAGDGASSSDGSPDCGCAAVDASTDAPAETGSGTADGGDAAQDSAALLADGSEDAGGTDGGDASQDSALDAGSTDSAVDDSSADGGGETRTTTGIVTALLGAQCEADALVNGCFANGQLCELAAGSTDAGTREDLCFSTLSCVLGGNPCVFGPPNIYACYCGAVFFPTCKTNPGPGACQAVEIQGLETSDPQTVLNTYEVLTTGAGVANAIADCISAVPSCNPNLATP